MASDVEAQDAHASQGEPNGRAVAFATRVATRPEIDGRLDDAVWQLATPIGELVQVEPVEGGVPSEATEVRIAYDADYLYIGVRCFDNEPEGIITTTRQRDAFPSSDDRIGLLLDTFLDRRNAFFFQLNAGGSKSDALISDNGNDVNEPWNGIWEGKSTIDSEGWSTELALPFKTLNFREGLSTWGLNVERFIGRRLESNRWSGSRQDYRLFDVVHAGDLIGLEGLRQGVGLDVVPFFVGSYENDRVDSDHDLDGDLGVDAFYKVTPSLTLSLTANTDFAESEVDERQINLTRFPVFFPERRDFFLQDAGVFEFPTPGTLIPFFTRRVGLVDGQEVPIQVGTKLTGRAGDFNIGVVDVLTGDATVDSQNLFAARLSRNVGEQSSIGAILTNGNPNGDGDNSVIGVDATYRTSSFLGDKNFRVSTYGLRSFSEAGGDEEFSYGLDVSYPNDTWGWFLKYFEIQEDFNPELGFVGRDDVRRYSTGLSYYPRPANEHVRWLEFDYHVDVFTDTDDELETVHMEFKPFGIQFESGDGFQLEVERTHEALSEPFEIREGITIPTGDHDFTRGRVKVHSSEKRVLSVFTSVTVGGFFDGRRDTYGGGLEWRPGPLFTGSFEYVHNDVDLEGGSFQTQLAQLRANFSFTPELAWNNFMQWDNESDTFGLNSRLLWIPEPGQEMFLVFNEALENENGSIAPTFQELTFKVGYTFRF